MDARPLLRRAAAPALVFVLCAAVYVATLGTRSRGLSDNAHFVHLAHSFLEGQLEVVGNKPPGSNDWAHYRDRWYVSFPPLPALVILPAVAVWGTKVWDRLYWALCAGLGPALLYVMLRALAERGLSQRSARENLALTALFAFGTAHYYTAVQGTVWFAAHVVCAPLLALYLLFSLGAARPLLAGSMLALAFMTRPTTLLLGAFFVLQALSIRRTAAPHEVPAGSARPWHLLTRVDWRAALPRLALFALPLLAVGGVAMWMNLARFDDPFEFGHSYLDIRWRGRIAKWGLFNYHYVAKNLAVFLAGLPWLTADAPYVRIGRHGLALWVTTPAVFWLLWPRRVSPTARALAVAAGLVALLDLAYQNSGWIQFSYRFSLDYMAPLVALLALGGCRFGALFKLALGWSIAVNLFGAITFDRAQRFYDQDLSQRVIFQPD
jgi:hypothetical protein